MSKAEKMKRYEIEKKKLWEDYLSQLRELKNRTDRDIVEMAKKCPSDYVGWRRVTCQHSCEECWIMYAEEVFG